MYDAKYTCITQQSLVAQFEHAKRWGSVRKELIARKIPFSEIHDSMYFEELTASQCAEVKGIFRMFSEPLSAEESINA